MTKKVMAQTDELFALVDGKPTKEVFDTRFNGGVATYRTFGLADAARRKKGKPELKIVRFVRAKEVQNG